MLISALMSLGHIFDIATNYASHITMKLTTRKGIFDNNILYRFNYVWIYSYPIITYVTNYLQLSYYFYYNHFVVVRWDKMCWKNTVHYSMIFLKKVIYEITNDMLKNII